tara:strand:- start:3451 stop:4098 length:648 start_codon:yes stop_codon:yes gene_type:complete
MSINLKERLITSIFLIFIFCAIFIYKSFLIFSFLIIGILSLIEFFGIMNKFTGNNFKKFLFNIIFIIYLSIFCVTFVLLSTFPQLKIILFIILLGCIGSDLGGYIVGKTLKGPKLTKISPNKTITGAFGSMIFSFIFISGTVYFVINKFSHEFIWISILTSLASQLGDLFFSYLKRKAKIKNTGNYLPGHGGILDRVDGILFGIPVGLITLIILH